MTITDIIWTAVVCLLGVEGSDYYFFGDGRGNEEWQAFGWTYRN